MLRRPASATLRSGIPHAFGKNKKNKVIGKLRLYVILLKCSEHCVCMFLSDSPIRSIICQWKQFSSEGKCLHQ